MHYQKLHYDVFFSTTITNKNINKSDNYNED